MAPTQPLLATRSPQCCTSLVIVSTQIMKVAYFGFWDKIIFFYFVFLRCFKIVPNEHMG